MTATKAIQSIIDEKKEGIPAPKEAWDTIRNYSQFTEYELTWLLNASAYVPEILFEENMESKINSLLQKWKERLVPHKF
jgi:hypothetical protein